MSIINTAEYLTTREAAKLLGVAQDSVKKYCQLGRIAAIWIGNQWLIHRREIAEYQKTRRQYNRQAGESRTQPEGDAAD